MSRWIPDLHRLSAQLILSFVALVFLTAAAVGMPAIWLIHSQLHHQAWGRVEQGSVAAQALYAAHEAELAGLADLTAQRPTLSALLPLGDEERLSEYLDTLRQSSGLDLVLVCDTGGRILAEVGQMISNIGCMPDALEGTYTVQAEPLAQAWLFAGQRLDSPTGSHLGSVLVGRKLDDAFAAQMRAQTGLEHTLLLGDQVMATSLAGRSLVPIPVPSQTTQLQWKLNGHPYYAARFQLDETGLQAEVALEVTDVIATERELVWTLMASILAVVVLASLAGAILAKRISAPLSHLVDAATAMSAGDLDSEVRVEARVREVALVSQALETARVDLNRSVSQMREEKAWTDHLLEAIVEGIVTLDRKGTITFFSHGAERITGWTRTQVLGRSCDHVFRPAETREPFSQLIPPPGHRRKIPVVLPDGRQAILDVTGARLLPPEIGEARVALVFRDISEEEAVHRLLGHFLANVAHEFRTPLTALAASVELLIDQAPDLSSTELAELLTSLHLGVLGLQTLIDNLLESASIETGHFRVHPRPSNLGEIIAEAIGMMQPLLDKHNQRLVVELPVVIPRVEADPRRTVQVLINLLSNAVKYGPDDAEIEVSAAVEQPWVRVTVADAGPGVLPEVRENLFRRFVHQSMGDDKAQVGAGLGLSVVKAIVQAHNGQVGFTERQSGGSAFWFTVPLEDGP
jgi:two-component system, OmpR family, phosphate regulon sensor histidine kinase PhoR